MQDIAVIVNIILCILSFALAAISVITVIVTLKQNNRMIESTSRPYIAIYTQSIITGEKPYYYLVIKNFGNSAAHFIKFDYDVDLTGCFNIEANKDFLKQIEKTVLAPNQSRICMFNYEAVPDVVKFEYEYSSVAQNKYVESTEVFMKAAINLPNAVSNDPQDRDERIISHTLQEMLKKSL